jgi:hypothetical protein
MYSSSITLIADFSDHWIVGKLLLKCGKIAHMKLDRLLIIELCSFQISPSKSLNYTHAAYVYSKRMRNKLHDKKLKTEERLIILHEFDNKRAIYTLR